MKGRRAGRQPGDVEDRGGEGPTNRLTCLPFDEVEGSGFIARSTYKQVSYLVLDYPTKVPDQVSARQPGQGTGMETWWSLETSRARSSARACGVGLVGRASVKVGQQGTECSCKASASAVLTVIDRVALFSGGKCLRVVPTGTEDWFAFPIH